mmetsp:Transcript_4370/g.10698  ORF Transcript_4370/g.10698 Transcript_4370/m.10698 type:complete len:160 (-) Transcript_4370:3744-4223(-)
MRMFSPINDERRARDELANLRQGKMSGSQYSHRFRTCLLSIPGMPESEQANWFYLGLNDETKNEVQKAQCTSLDEMIRLATAFSDAYIVAGRRPHVQTPPGAVPMELGATDARRTQTGGARKRPGPRICYSCGKPGHLARDCKAGKGQGASGEGPGASH